MKKILNIVLIIFILFSLFITEGAAVYAVPTSNEEIQLSMETCSISGLINNKIETDVININTQFKSMNDQFKSISDYSIACTKPNLYIGEYIINKQIAINNITAYAVENSTQYSGKIYAKTNLLNRQDITADEINEIINHFLSKNGCGSKSELYNTGQAFINASKQTGYDPIFLLSLAAAESGWNVSRLHAGKNNPYSINMVDDNPSLGYHMGDTFEDGIVNGAIWIKNHYYDNGYTSLYSMIHGGKKYASAGDVWINNILSIMNQSYRILYNKED